MECSSSFNFRQRHASKQEHVADVCTYMYNNFRVCLGEQGRVVPIRWKFQALHLCMLNSFGTTSFVSLHKPGKFIPLKKDFSLLRW
jgi:hypothetical protein